MTRIPTMNRKPKITAKSHHRNGVCGAPFDIYLFDWHDEGTTRHMIGIDFGDRAFAVLDTALLANGDIAFGSNSWRGDHFEAEVRKAGAKFNRP
jgi:hypothetical protein